MSRFRECAVVALLVTAMQAAGLAGPGVQITPLTKDGRVLVSFRFNEPFAEDLRSAIHSGLLITFVYDIELKRSSTLWLDRTIASATVMATVRYDNLTRRYYLTRKADGRVESSDTVEREDDAREWLTSFDKLPLFSSALLQRNAEYLLRISARTTPRNASFIWPWERGIAGLAKFTFLQ